MKSRDAPRNASQVFCFPAGAFVISLEDNNLEQVSVDVLAMEMRFWGGV